MYISELKIDNFRSLKNIHLVNMQRVCVFHGDNNSGKSNILAAIEAILRSKTAIQDPGAVEQEARYKRVPFHQGRLRGFLDNFRFGGKEPIPFRIGITFDDPELSQYQEVIEQIQSDLKLPKKAAKNAPPQPRGLKLNDGHKKTLSFEGELTYIDYDTCEAVTRRIDINKNFVLFELVNDTPSYIPSLEKSAVSLGERERVVAELTNRLTDSFQLLGTNRAVDREKLTIAEPPTDFLSPATFKRSLFRLATNRETFDVFKEIDRRFSSEPFSFGQISFSVDPKTEEVEVMIEKSTARLPLNRIGSGLQQILFLIANIVHQRHRIIGIEEIELNLSPEAQKRVFETVKALVYETKLINQVLVTSHSPYFRNRLDVGYYEVSYDQKTLTTLVKPSTKPGEKKFFGGGWLQD